MQGKCVRGVLARDPVVRDHDFELSRRDDRVILAVAVIVIAAMTARLPQTTTTQSGQPRYVRMKLPCQSPLFR